MSDHVESAEIERNESPSPLVEEQIKYRFVDIKTGLHELSVAHLEGNKAAIREAYHNLTHSYPTANLIWYSWAQFEFLNGDFAELETLFTRCLKSNLSVPLWKLYLSYVRNLQLPTIEDESEARQTMLKAYDFAVSHIGFDVHSGPIWGEYIDYCQTHYYQLCKEKVTTWEQQNLMDLTRKIYHRALSIPIEGLEQLWHAYDAYENSLNKLTAKKLVTERSSAYMAARSVTKELMDLMGEIDLDAYPLDPATELSAAERHDRLASWMKWINWERANPLTLSNRAILHSRIIYAFRRALMSCRRDSLLWQAYATYLRSEVARLEDAEIVLKQSKRHCPFSSDLVLALADLKEAQGADFEAIKMIMEEFLNSVSVRLDDLKSEIITVRKTPIDNDDEAVFTAAILDRDCVPVESYLLFQDDFNTVQVAFIDIARRLAGLNAARGVFAAARKSVHVTAPVFAAAATLEFRIRKDAAIATKIYELGLTRFPNDYLFARDYLNFLLAQNDDSNIRALFERILANIESFRATHTLEVISRNEDKNVIAGIWRDFYVFEQQIGDYQSVQKFEERMRASLPGLQTEALFYERLGLKRLDDFLAGFEAMRQEQPEFTLPRIQAKETAPFHLSEPVFTLFLKVNEALIAKGIKQFEGPSIETEKFLSFIDRVNVPSTDKQPAQTQMRRPQPQAERPRHQREQYSGQRRRHRDREYDDDRDSEERSSKQPRSGIFEERRR